MNDIPTLLENLKKAISNALWNSDEVSDSIAMLADAAGEIHISVDVVLPEGADMGSCAVDDSDEVTKAHFLHSIRN